MELYYIGTMQEKCQPALDVFAKRGCTIHSFASLEEACTALKKAETKPDLAILDESEERQDPATMRRAVMDVMSINAFTYATAMTSFDAEVYHDAMEGLGMLTGLPVNPSSARTSITRPKGSSKKTNTAAFPHMFAEGQRLFLLPFVCYFLFFRTFFWYFSILAMLAGMRVSRPSFASQALKVA